MMLPWPRRRWPLAQADSRPGTRGRPPVDGSAVRWRATPRSHGEGMSGTVSYWMISELLDDLGGDGAGCGAGLRAWGPGRYLRGTVRAPAGRRDRHGCLQR